MNHQNNEHDRLWQAIGAIQKDLGETKKEVHETRENVAYMRGILEEMKRQEDRKFTWKHGAIMTALGSVLTFFFGNKPPS